MFVALIVVGCLLAAAAAVLCALSVLQESGLGGILALVLLGLGATGIVMGVQHYHNAHQQTLAAHLQAQYGARQVGDAYPRQRGPVLIRMDNGAYKSCQLYGSYTRPVAVCAGSELPRRGH